jgi:HD-GYP domain-containing protein (c-di-GMP phosphodiesterase class II)
MTTDRVYRGAMSTDEAMAELHANSGSQFDPSVVAAVATVVRRRAVPATAADEVRALLASAPRPRDIPAANTAS